MSRLAEFRRSVADAEAALDEYRPTLEAFWARQVRRIAKVAVENLYRMQPGALAAAGRPDWSLPNDDEIVPIDQQARELAALLGTHFEAMYRILVDVGASAGLSFDVRNRIVEEVLATRGQHITRITETIRAEIMEQLRQAYEEGESLAKAARRVSNVMRDRSVKRAGVIARTEMIGASNGASVRLASILDNTSLNADGTVRTDTLGHDPIRIWKSWYATMDNRTRPTHVTANGQTVKMTDLFVVGSSRMQYPGDPSGGGDEVINCRCTVVYTESAP